MMTAQDVSDALEGTPFLVEQGAAAGMARAVEELHGRVVTLRSVGQLNEETLRRYYGDKRFEQVAESNAIEGSTLSVGETELAVTKGVTLTGHDPAYVRDAVALDRALSRLAVLARERDATDIEQLQELHGLILEGSPHAGRFRDVAVRISGSVHRPPKTWKAVMSAMEEWERWSKQHDGVTAPLRAAILHAWLVHIHPYRDGNGRAARALQNLELVRAGYPPAIIRRKQDRDRYIDALHRADEGDLALFLDLIVDRTGAALTGLELAAREKQGYDQKALELRSAQQRRLDVWTRAVELLYSVVVDRLSQAVEGAGGKVHAELIGGGLALEDYIELCNGRPVSRSWAFRISVAVPAIDTVNRLAWVGYRSERMRLALQADAGAPALFWSMPNPEGYPPWVRVTADAPGPEELTIDPARGDEWYALTAGHLTSLSTSELAKAIVDGFLEKVRP